jgi:Arc/MetJ family transcription regulator
MTSKILEAIIMRITIIVDDDLVEKARDITGVDEVSVILCDALTDLVSKEAARRLASPRQFWLTSRR